MSNSNKGAAALTTTVTPEYQKVNRETPPETHVLIGLKGRSPKENEERKPIRIVAAVDHSGSMAGNKVHYLRASMRALVRQLGDNDYLGIVAFGSDVWTVAKPTRCDQQGRESLLTQIDTLGATSMTNLCGGATEAITMLRDVDIDRKDCIERVFLLTDGCPTHGVTNDDNVVSLISKTAGKDINLTTFGYGEERNSGSGYNPSLLEAIAKACRGNFHHISNPDAVPKALATELGGLMTTVAQNIKVTLDLKDNVEVLHVLNDFDVETTDGRTKISVDDLYIDEEKAITLRLKLPTFTKAAGARPKKNLGNIQIQWLDTRTGELVNHVMELKLDFVKPGEEDQNANPNVEKQVALLKAAEAQREAIEKANHGDFDGAQLSLRNAADGLKKCKLFEKDNELKQVHEVYVGSIGDYSNQRYSASVEQRGTSFTRSLHTKRDAGMLRFYSSASTSSLVDSMSADVDDQMEKETFANIPHPALRINDPMDPELMGYHTGTHPARKFDPDVDKPTDPKTTDRSTGYTKRRMRR